MIRSAITGGATTYLFRAQILGKHSVTYYRCNDTGLIQTEYPYWLDEAYSDPIAEVDVGLVQRNLTLSSLVERLILDHFDANSKFLDYGGGYGLFVRLMRDKGFRFFRSDPHCENFFAKHFDLRDLCVPHHFELVTAFELFEHVYDPVSLVERLLEYSDTLLFSTELVPRSHPMAADDWWYFCPETGQHVTFYTRAALEELSRRFGLNFATDSSWLHVMSKRNVCEDFFANKPDTKSAFRQIITRVFARRIKQARRKSLLQSDHELALSCLRQRLRGRTSHSGERSDG